MERKTVDLIVGKAVDEAEAQKAGQSKVGEGHPVPTKGGEVGGRSGPEYVICPRCSAINYVYVDDDVYLYYWCWYTAQGKHYFRV
jgi:hypothetical protein